MEFLHHQINVMSRNKGKSAVAAAAYRAGSRLVDQRTGEVWDYTKKKGIYSTKIYMPDDTPPPAIADLWNAAERAEKRKDAAVAQEWEVALPNEMTNEQRDALAEDIANSMSKLLKIPVQASIHCQNGNWHVHCLGTTRQFENGQFTVRTDNLVDSKERKKRGLKGGRKDDVVAYRELVAEIINTHYAKCGINKHISHLSYEEQGIDKLPQIKMGASHKLEKRGIQTERGDINREITEINKDENEFHKLGIPTKLQNDRTYRAMVNQINAMQAREIEIGIYNREKDTFKLIMILIDKLLDMFGLLKNYNSNGCDIYIRPKVQSNLILVDDIDSFILEQMKADGLEPAIVVETSPKNLQAWIRLDTDKLDKVTALVASRELQSRYNSDKGAIGANHFGRLAGFTNRKVEYLTEKGYPFALLREYNDKIASNGKQFLQSIEQKVAVEKVKSTLNLHGVNEKLQLMDIQKLKVVFNKYGDEYTKRKITDTIDFSTRDFAVTCRMLKEGAKESALVEILTDVAKRKHKNENSRLDYAIRTVQKAKERITKQEEEKEEQRRRLY